MTETEFAQPILSRRTLMLAGGALLLLPGRASRSAAAALPAIKAFRNPGCGCCEIWAEHMRRAGFSITVVDDPELTGRRARLGVPEEISGCHTAVIGDYVIEGHVPPEDILSFLAVRPNARGLAVPGMPMGSPGMEMGRTANPYDVLIFTADGSSKVYASH